MNVADQLFSAIRRRKPFVTIRLKSIRDCLRRNFLNENQPEIFECNAPEIIKRRKNSKETFAKYVIT